MTSNTSFCVCERLMQAVVHTATLDPHDWAIHVTVVYVEKRADSLIFRC